jgi:exodeoxyribonuclease V alpha subunit
MEELTLEFYNNGLKKIVYSKNNNELDFSRVRTKLDDGETYVCKTLPENNNVITDCYPLKSMQFEIRNIKESTTYDNTYSCSVRVLSYEDGREYPHTDNVVVVGYFYNAYPEAIYDTCGYWDQGKDGRDIFFVTERQQLITSSENSIKKYLSSILKGKGIGKATIEKLVNEFGCDTLLKIKDNDSALSGIIKNAKKRELVIEALNQNNDSEKSLNFLIQNNIDAEMAISIINKLGSTSFLQLTNDPYVLLKFNNIALEMVNAIALKMGKEYNSEQNIDGLIMRYLYYRTSTFGDIYVEQNDFFERHNGFTNFELFYDKYNRYMKFTKPEILSSLNRLVDNHRIVISKNVDDESKQLIYEESYYKMETYIVERLKYFKSVTPKTFIEDSIVEQRILEFESNGIKLDPIQIGAIKQAFKNKLSIISGGPGTGKTLVTKAIVDVFRKTFPTQKVQLCAPTGKASRRMSDVIGLPACTIHRKIGYGCGDDMPIEENLLIIDECSMMDIELFNRTLDACSDDTTIILVGDYNQLPSVGPGLILRDLIDSNVIPSTILKSVFRQSNGSEIITAANAVLDKQESFINMEYGKDFVFIEQNSTQEVYENIAGCIKYLVNNGVNSDRIQILTPQNEGLIGTTGLNNMMRDICNPPNIRGEGILIRNTMFFPGDRIIETENNTEKGIFNGSMGTILRISSDETVADFDGRTVILSTKEMHTVKLGYAITVHKSQGSEFDFVFMPIVNEHEFTLNKNLLYTGITRAKKMFVLLGQREALNNTIHKEIVWDRKSQIKNKLIKAK